MVPFCLIAFYLCFLTFVLFSSLYPLKLLPHVGHKKQSQQNGYSTWDPRKAKNGEVPQYDEIPYGDVGPSGKGQLPEVPAEYSQVPQIPQRQGINCTKTSLIRMALGIVSLYITKVA